MAPPDDPSENVAEFTGPAGGWGSLRSVEGSLLHEGRAATGHLILSRQNKPGGYSCVSCSWAKPEKPRPFEFCENGAKATAWEVTRSRVDRDFFENHTITELLGWSDHELEKSGRLTHPMRLDRGRDRWVPVAWEEAFQAIGKALQAMDPKKTVFYSSGRASLETSYLYALFARLYGHNNLPDSSNMCHESTSVALPEAIGAPVGTVQLDDLEQTQCILAFGQNVGTSSPRALHALQHAARRDVPIIVFNPLREPGWERFSNPQDPVDMLVRPATRIASQYHQLRAGGDLAVVTGMAKTLIEADDVALAAGRPAVLDHGFIQAHTHGFAEFAAWCRSQEWAEILRWSGLSRAAIEEAAHVYAKADAAIGLYGMGITQHRKGVEAVRMLVNLLLLRGNIGKPGAGVLPVRGHSNVQGQRTVGITEKPELAPLDRLAEQYGFSPPREKGLTTVETCEKVLKREIQAFIGLGGNFVRAVPETRLMEAAWADIPLTVQIATKLNRSHLVNGREAYLLPCLGRLEEDVQASGPQAVTCEDTMTHVHASLGKVTPASPDLLSEPAIVAGLARATLAPNPRVPWEAWVGDYACIRDAIEATYPDMFQDYNKRAFQPGGFPRPLPARQRQWKTKTGRANFFVPSGFRADRETELDDPDILQLITLRSNEQFNTTIYALGDRFRGISGTREVVMMSPAEAARRGLAAGEMVELSTVAEDGVPRSVGGLRLVLHDLPDGAIAGYYPECNPLIPLWHHAERAQVPAAKAVPVRLRRQG